MVSKRKYIAAGLDDISTEEDYDSDLDVKPCFGQRYFENSKENAIELDSDESDIEMLEIKLPNRRFNDVWRNIIECDFLEEQITGIGLRTNRVERDVESYDLPPCKKRKCSKPKCYKKRKGRIKKRMKGRNFQYKTSSFCSSDDDVQIIEKKEPLEDQYIVLDDSDEEYENKSFMNITSSISPVYNSDSDSSSMDDDLRHPLRQRRRNLSKTKKNYKTDLKHSWTELAERVQNNEFLVEFEEGRKEVATRIARRLQEPKIDLIDRCLIYLGLKQCRIFLEAVKEIEESGGMPTKDGSRLRTPGGVFFTLIRSDRSIEKDMKNLIFQEDELQQQDESLWWKSLEILQYRNNPRSLHCASNFARRKEFKSYTLIDLDFFESLPDFRYRYIPMMSNFPISHDSDNCEGGGSNSTEEYNEDDDFMRLPDYVNPDNACDL